MLNLAGAVGPQQLSDGSQAPLRLGNHGDLVTSLLHGRYHELAKRGQLWWASNQAAQAISVALNTTYTGLCLSNPLNSGKNLELLLVGYALSVAPAAIASIHLIGGSSPSTNVTHTTPVTPRNALLGNADTPAAKVDSAATIPTPEYLMSLMGGFTAGALPSSPNALFDIGGAFVLGPGGFIAIGALTAVTGFGSFLWAEVPILN